MKCSESQRLISAERDRALAEIERAGLEAHLAACAGCRESRARLAAAADAWRAASAAVPTPEVERAWLDIRRAIRGAANPAGGRARSRGSFVSWAAGSLAAAAAMAVALFVSWPAQPANPANPASEWMAPVEVARAEYVDAGEGVTPVVYVDDDSGWLVVWTVADSPGAGS